MSKSKRNEMIIKMKNEMKKLRVCSKTKILRLVKTGEIDFKDGIFRNKITLEPIGDLQYKTKFRDDLDDIDQQLEDEGLTFEDCFDESASFNK